MRSNSSTITQQLILKSYNNNNNNNTTICRQGTEIEVYRCNYRWCTCILYMYTIYLYTSIYDPYVQIVQIIDPLNSY